MSSVAKLILPRIGGEDASSPKLADLRFNFSEYRVLRLIEHSTRSGA